MQFISVCIMSISELWGSLSGISREIYHHRPEFSVELSSIHLNFAKRSSVVSWRNVVRWEWRLFLMSNEGDITWDSRCAESISCQAFILVQNRTA